MKDADAEARIRELLAAGDVKLAATEAIRYLSPRVLRYQRSILHDEDEEGDAFSDFAEALWKGLPGFRWECSLVTWAFRLAWHAALRVRSDPARRHARRLDTTDASRLADEVRTKSFARLERQRQGVEMLLTELSAEDQSLFALRIGERMSWADIAVVLTKDGQPIDENTVAKRFSRLKERLARMAKDRGLLD